MRNFIIIVFVVLISLNGNILGQSTPHHTLELTRQNPHGWFSFRLPSDMRRLDGFVDVDGARYESKGLEISLNYWTYRNTPNYLRGEYVTNLILACPKTNRARTNRTWIDGNRAVIQSCAITDDRKGFRYIYFVTFPKLKVFDGEKFRYGMFNFTVEYKVRGYSGLAKRIVRSLNFEMKRTAEQIVGRERRLRSFHDL